MRNLSLAVAIVVIGSVALLVLGCAPTPTPVKVQPEILPTRTPSTPTSTMTPAAIPTATATKIPLETLTALLPTPIPTLVVTAEPEVNLMTEEEALALAKKTLAEKLGVDEEEIEVRFLTRVNWPDTSLGCPQKGMVYAQVIIPGYRVQLLVGDRAYSVHVGDGRAIVCERGQEATLPKGLDPKAIFRLVELARKDLAERLGIPIEDVKPIGGNIMTWPDTSLGCPQPGVTYEQVETPGYKLVLEAQGQTYTYHTDHERVVLCEQDSQK